VLQPMLDLAGCWGIPGGAAVRREGTWDMVARSSLPPNVLNSVGCDPDYGSQRDIAILPHGVLFLFSWAGPERFTPLWSLFYEADTGAWGALTTVAANPSGDWLLVDELLEVDEQAFALYFDGGNLAYQVQRFDGAAWEAPLTLTTDLARQPHLAASGDVVLAVAQDGDQPVARRWDGAWSAPEPLGPSGAGLEAAAGGPLGFAVAYSTPAGVGALDERDLRLVRNAGTGFGPEAILELGGTPRVELAVNTWGVAAAWQRATQTNGANVEVRAAVWHDDGWEWHGCTSNEWRFGAGTGFWLACGGGGDVTVFRSSETRLPWDGSGSLGATAGGERVWWRVQDDGGAAVWRYLEADGFQRFGALSVEGAARFSAPVLHRIEGGRPRYLDLVETAGGGLGVVWLTDTQIFASTWSAERGFEEVGRPLGLGTLAVLRGSSGAVAYVPQVYGRSSELCVWEIGSVDCTAVAHGMIASAQLLPLGAGFAAAFSHTATASPGAPQLSLAVAAAGEGFAPPVELGRHSDPFHLAVGGGTALVAWPSDTGEILGRLTDGAVSESVDFTRGSIDTAARVLSADHYAGMFRVTWATGGYICDGRLAGLGATLTRTCRPETRASADGFMVANGPTQLLVTRGTGVYTFEAHDGAAWSSPVAGPELPYLDRGIVAYGDGFAAWGFATDGVAIQVIFIAADGTWERHLLPAPHDDCREGGRLSSQGDALLFACRDHGELVAWMHDGAAWRQPVVVLTGVDTNDSDGPQVARLAGGGWAVAWQQTSRPARVALFRDGEWSVRTLGETGAFTGGLRLLERATGVAAVWEEATREPKRVEVRLETDL
jgi:hypothetical protein